jgi:hypothetical protein
LLIFSVENECHAKCLSSQSICLDAALEAGLMMMMVMMVRGVPLLIHDGSMDRISISAQYGKTF